MSLGGYKFAGRYCQKGSLTDAQWALKMHKTKVAAFMAANTLSGAGWDYDMTGSPDGNYHCLDTVGNNYVTVFKRTNGTDDYTWFALYTLTYFTGTGTASGSVKVALVNNMLSSTNYYIGYNACNFYRIGTFAIAYNDDLTATATGTTGLLVVGNSASMNSNVGSSYYPTSSYAATGASSVYFGFAEKSDDIVMFQGCDSLSNIGVSVASGHAFSSFVNSNDSKGLFAYNLQRQANGQNGAENASRNTNGTKSELNALQLYTGDVAYGAPVGAHEIFAIFTQSPQEYPYQSVPVFCYNAQSKNYGKGTLKLELIAENAENATPSSSSSFATVANGKYLTVLTGSVVVISALNEIIGIPNSYFRLYVGWDPSNPDITQASSWTEYTD